jgi:hypothetical protein
MTSSKRPPRTLLPPPLTKAVDEKTIDLGLKPDKGLILESILPPTHGGLAVDARRGRANSPTVPGVLRRRGTLRRSIVLAVITSVGLVALGLVLGSLARRRAAVASTPRDPPATASPAPSPSAAPVEALVVPDAGAVDSGAPTASTSAKPSDAGARPRRPKTKKIHKP